ncbi:MAG TPA: cbb3-type cytochrome c oxidase subunit I [Tepidisphaeraceae bacterium]
MTQPRGIRSWIFSLDHKRIGLMYMLAILVFLFVGELLAIILRSKFLTPGLAIPPSADTAARARALDLYNQLFTLHGVVMVFLVMIPGIPAVLGNFVLPMMLGARNVAFPRINRLGFQLYCMGALVLLYVVASGVAYFAFGKTLPAPPGGFKGGGQGGLDSGWTFSIPYATEKAGDCTTLAILGISILALSSILSAANFVVSIHTLRPPGMSWFRMPLFLWGLYGASIVQIVATPVLVITLLLVAAERFWHVGIFDPNFGGDPVLFQHFFWFFAHPAGYIMLLGAMGIISELVCTFSRKHIFGYAFLAYSFLTIALAGFLGWGQHLFVSGSSGLVNAIFGLLSFSVAIPFAITICSWLATLYRGSIRLAAPMLYAIAFIALFTVGSLSGLFFGSIATSIHLIGTSFLVAHFHYLVAGSTLFAFLGGMYYWWPKITGRMVSEKWSAIAALLVFVGFNGTFFPLFIAGSRGMPERHATYNPQYQLLQLISTLGAYLMAVGLVMVVLSWLHSLRWGRKAPANPWGGNTLEWFSPSPPPAQNLPVTESLGDPYDLSAWRFTSAQDGWVRQLGAVGGDGKHHANASNLPADTVEPQAPVPDLADSFATKPQGYAAGRLGMWIFIAAEVLMFGGLGCAYAAYRHNYPAVFAYAHQYLNKTQGAGTAAVLLACSFCMALALRCAQLGRRAGLIFCLGLTLLGGLGFMGIKSFEYRDKWKHDLWVGPRNRYHKESKIDPVAAEPKTPAEKSAGAEEAEPPEPRRQGPADQDPFAGTPDEPKIKPSFLNTPGLAPPGAAPEPAGRHLGYLDLTKAERARVSTFFSLYFLLTGLHALQVLIGIGLVIWLMLRAIRRKISPAYFAPVDLVGLYWHLMTLIWFFLFPLLYLIHSYSRIQPP